MTYDDSDSDVMVLDDESEFEGGELSDSDDDFMAEENTAPARSKKTAKAKAPAKKAAAKKPAAKKPAAKKPKKTAALAPNQNADNVPTNDNDMDDFDDDDDASIEVVKGKESSKSIEERYQKKTQLEHILLRPDTYIGSTERHSQKMFVLDPEREKLVERDITFTPGLYKIFDEIVVNAADNKQRDPNMNELDIEIDAEANIISVKNNGKGIPVQKHTEHNCYVPTLIFGHLLTGSNFDDGEKKTTGGRNGYGAKLANIFSTEFTVECVDSEQGLKFKQVFRNNMEIAGTPIVSNCTAAEKKKGDYTKVSFKPELKRFSMTSLDKDAVGLLSKRAYDIAGSMQNREGKKLGVTLNGKKLPIKSFQDYLKLFEGITPPSAYMKIDRWEVGVSPSDGTAQQISFVNAISTPKGGGHVNYIVDQVANHLVKTVKKKNKGGTEVKPSLIKNHLCIFVNCLVENPTFDSQTKDQLTSRPKTFGSKCELQDKFLKQVDKSGVVESVLSFAKFKQNEALKRKGGVKRIKLTGIAKLDDANNAGSAKSKDCTLILTEGDSAKSLAMSGLSVVGRDFYGVFPLRGKPLNVRDANHQQLMKNEEIKAVIDILGLKFGTIYDEQTIKTLRYGRLMIMADQDHDGSHIKGLVINFIHNFWPSLLDIPGFLQQFITPIVKATKSKKTKTFFTLPEYDLWRKLDENKGYKIKYYKGLGTSTSAEAKEYFANLDLHEVRFDTLSTDKTAINGGEDAENMEFEDAIVPDKQVSGSDLIDMVFRKARVEDRKSWLNAFEQDTFLDYSKAQAKGVKYSDFINREFILFSKSDCARSIPHVMDGFKPSQRKVLFACFKRKLKNEIKVAQLAGYIGEHSAYHHGEASLHGTITNMAQDFVGSNNLNLLTPSGQFGTRRMGGKDAASPRYIFTKLEPVTRAIFHPDDDELLNYLNDDGLSIEPDFYMPVIPLVLVNGSDGIGTGWSSTVPNYCPREIISNIRRMIQGEPVEKMEPKYYGFSGEIIPKTGEKSGQYTVEGRIERTNETTLFISELPVKKWTQDYKVFLENMMNGDAKTPPEIRDFRENHTDTTVSFTITADAAKIDGFEKFKGGLYGKFKLVGSLSTANMHLFDAEARITKYDNPEAIMSIFFELRVDFYVKRKALLVEKMQREQRMLSNRARFVEEVCRGELVVSNRKRKELLVDLKERGYETFHKDPKKQAKDADNEEDEEEEEEDTSSDADLAKGYEYLLGMKIWSLTFEKAARLKKELEEKTQALEILEATEPSQIWLNDLDAVENALDERDVGMKKAVEEEKRAQNKNKKRTAAKKKKAAATKKHGKKKAHEWDSDLEESSDDNGFNSDSDSDMEVMEVAASKKAPVARRKPAAATKPAAKPAAKTVAKRIPAPKKVVAPKVAKVPDSPEPVEELSQSLKQLMSPAKAKGGRPSSSPGEKKARGQKRPSPRAEEEDDFFEDKENLPKPSFSLTKKVATKKQQAPKRTKKVIHSDSESEDDGFMSSGDGSSVVVAPAPSRARSGRARSKVVYNVDEDSESDFMD